MKKFKFKLQTVHRVRQLRLEKEQLVLARLQNEADQIRREIEQTDETRIRAITNYQEMIDRGELTDPVEMEMHLRHITDLERRRCELLVRLEEKKLACAEQCRRVAAHSREVQVTNRLRENQQTQYKQELERHEQNTLDDLISTDFARRLTENK